MTACLPACLPSPSLPTRRPRALPQAALDASNAVVAEKRARLADVRSKVAGLQRQLADTQAELAALTHQVGP